MTRKRREHSPEELANDPSLKWNDYKRYELVYVKPWGKYFRFLEYIWGGKRVRLTERNSLRVLDETVEALDIRRPNYDEL